MEPQTPEPTTSRRSVQSLYWLAAAAMMLATVFAAMEKPVDWMKLAGRGSLIAALILLATARPEETRAKKAVIYLLSAIALGFLIASLVNRA